MKHCLIVEDDRPIALDLSDCMDSIGLSCDTSETVSEASYKLKSAEYDLVLLDYALPDGNTLALVELARLRNPDVKLIMISGTGIFPNGEQAIFAPGVDWILRKPLKMNDLKAVIQYVTRH